MATQKKAPTKEEFLALLRKKGINSLEDLVDAIMPETDETGGYAFKIDMGEGSDAAGDYLDMAMKRKGYGPDVIQFSAGIHSLFGELWPEEG